ncbi:hypothetical protein [Variovorax ginsengisoli]|uniref:DUF2474 domain-containing protein n=1 Tax=Variovorax ginsengisoli TaxID=363844 RepID=A0ABT9SBU8_9BURK|nr:hypothetical protein [Variovorax ginsengisoli]MDP9901827.1 hypothetical protein [Variovorax ginsengisoli]
MDEDEMGKRRTDLKLRTEKEEFDRTLWRWVLWVVVAVIAVVIGCLYAFVRFLVGDGRWLG